MTLAYRVLTEKALEAALDRVAALRIAVFREFPYLYDGDPKYERRYLESYRNNPEAILVGAFDGKTLVGASTGTPLTQHDAAFQRPVAAAGLPPERVFYLAESVLLPEYRGQGAGHVFFDLREAHARALGADWTVFCAVVRATDHPMRPSEYRPLDPFWRSRGYAPLSGAKARFEWRVLGEAAPETHDLAFWARKMTGVQLS